MVRGDIVLFNYTRQRAFYGVVIGFSDGYILVALHTPEGFNEWHPGFMCKEEQLELIEGV